MRHAQLALFEGGFAEADAAIHEALEIGLPVQSANAQLAYDLQMYALRREQGRLDELVDVVQQAVVDYPAYPVWRYVLADVFAELGRADDARAALAAHAAEGYPLYLEMQWLFALGLLADVCRHLDAAGAAAELYELLRPYARRNAVLPPELSSGAVSRPLGVLAATASSWDSAAAHFQDALELNARMGARPWLARTRCDYALMLVARDTPGDRERADELVTSGAQLAEELGMTALTERLAQL